MLTSLAGRHVKCGKFRSRSQLAVVKADYATAFAMAEMDDVAPSNSSGNSLAVLFGGGGAEFAAPRVEVDDSDSSREEYFGEIGLAFRDFAVTLPVPNVPNKENRELKPLVFSFCDLDPTDRRQLRAVGIR